MPKFAQATFSEDYFGTDVVPKTFRKKAIRGIPLGFEVRKQVRKEVIFRVRRGNGFYGSIAGHRYQDKFGYFLPTSYATANIGPYRQQWIASVHKWLYDLTAAQKGVYNERANAGLRMSGFNLFMREAMKGDVEMYVDRGDPATYDYAKEDLTIDGAWHDMDLSGIVPAGAKAVLIAGHVEGNGVDWTIKFRKKGNTNEVNHEGMETIRANVVRHRSSIVSLDVDRMIEYKADAQDWATLDLAIRGWWT